MTIIKQKSWLLEDKILIGWQEWCALPELHIWAIKSKIDTGAKTSALHASNIKLFKKHGAQYVRFTIYPIQGNYQYEKRCTARVIDERVIMNSGGHKERRFIIRTSVRLGQAIWDIDISLTNRDPMRFRMLLGRDALKKHTVIDPARMLCKGKLNSKQIRRLYEQHLSD